MDCSSCSHPLAEQARFCDHCGMSAAVYEHDKESLKIYCGKCHGKLKGAKIYCCFCGEPSALSRQKKNASKLAELLQDPRVRFVIAAAICALVIAPTVVWMFSKTDPPRIPPAPEAPLQGIPARFTLRPAVPDVDGAAAITRPTAVTTDQSGNTYVADAATHKVYKISIDGTVTTYAGSGKAGFSGDGGLAGEADLNQPRGLAFDVNGNLYIADSGNSVVRGVDINGNIRTVAGYPPVAPSASEMSPALEIQLMSPSAVDIGRDGDIFITEDPAAHGDRPPQVWILEPEVDMTRLGEFRLLGAL